MITGLVRGDEAWIRLKVFGIRGREKQIEALIDTGYTTMAAEMRGGKLGDIASLHPRSQLMYDLLGESQTKNDLSRLQTYLADPDQKINVGKGTIDMMVFDTTARTDYLSRGSSYNLSWQKFAFGKK